MTVKPKKPTDSHPEKDQIWELVRTLVLGGASAEDMLELYYWSRDPALLAMLRKAVLAPEDTRRQLFEFFADSNPKDISASTQLSPRRLILTA